MLEGCAVLSYLPSAEVISARVIARKWIRTAFKCFNSVIEYDPLLQTISIRKTSLSLESVEFHD